MALDLSNGSAWQSDPLFALKWQRPGLGPVASTGGPLPTTRRMAGVAYPEEHLVAVQSAVAGVVALSWIGFVVLWLLRRRSSPAEVR